MIVLHLDEIDFHLSLFPDKSLLLIFSSSQSYLLPEGSVRVKRTDEGSDSYSCRSNNSFLPSLKTWLVMKARGSSKSSENRSRNRSCLIVQQTGIHNITLELLQETCNHAVQYNQSSAEKKCHASVIFPSSSSSVSWFIFVILWLPSSNQMFTELLN